MSKPIDEQWETHRIAPYDQPGVCTTNGLPVAEVVVRYVPDGRTSRRDIETADAEAALIAASPDMARALLGCREHLCCSDGCRCDVCAALRKAGVLP